MVIGLEIEMVLVLRSGGDRTRARDGIRASARVRGDDRTRASTMTRDGDRVRARGGEEKEERREGGELP